MEMQKVVLFTRLFAAITRAVNGKRTSSYRRHESQRTNSLDLEYSKWRCPGEKVLLYWLQGFIYYLNDNTWGY
jgi:hypothetical protein